MVPPVPPIVGFAEALASPSTFAADVGETSGAPPATAMQRSLSKASLVSVAMEITRDPTAASPGVIEFMSAVLPPDLSPQEVQARMGDPPQYEELVSPSEQRTAVPADPAALDALM